MQAQEPPKFGIASTMVAEQTMAKKKSTGKHSLTKNDSPGLIPDGLVDELRELIVQTRSNVAQTVNTALVNLYWEIGTRIRSEVLGNERAEYGKEICSTLSNKLVAEFGSGFSRPNLTKMLQFSELFPDSQIVVTLSVSNRLTFNEANTEVCPREGFRESLGAAGR